MIPCRSPARSRRFDIKGDAHLVAQFIVEGFDGEGRSVGVGKSPVNDLLLNNLGVFLGDLFRVPSQASGSFTLVDSSGVSRTVFSYSSQPATAGSIVFGLVGVTTPSPGGHVGVGSSNTAPVRADRNLTTILGAISPVLSSGYTPSTGRVSASGSIGIAAGGIVREAGIFVAWRIDDGTLEVFFMVAHDLVSPAVTIPAFGSAAVNWVLQI